MAEINLCSIDGCNKPKRKTSKLYCSMHSERKRKGLEMSAPPMLSPPGAPQDFFDKIESGESDCIIWPFARTASGYAQYNPPAPYTSKIVSRNVCIKFHGNPEKESDEATHSCGKGQEGCVNPDHLVWKDHRGNMADKIAHGTHRFGETSPSAKLTESDVIEMRKTRSSGVTYQAIADQYMVDYRTAYNACTGKTWSHL